jgi:hypothetical protein
MRMLEQMDGSPLNMRLWPVFAIVTVAWFGWAHGPVWADEGFACVRCTAPNQTYRCQVMSEDAIPRQALNYFCMAQVAHEHIHESCAVVRGAPSTCQGQDVSYVYQDGVGDQSAMAGGGAAEPAGPDQEPKTLADMTRGSSMEQSFKAMGDATAKAGKAVGDATVQAGQAVGDATKRTLECLGSALNAC